MNCSPIDPVPMSAAPATITVRKLVGCEEHDTKLGVDATLSAIKSFVAGVRGLGGTRSTSGALTAARSGSRSLRRTSSSFSTESSWMETTRRSTRSV